MVVGLLRNYCNSLYFSYATIDTTNRASQKIYLSVTLLCLSGCGNKQIHQSGNPNILAFNMASRALLTPNRPYKDNT